VLVPKYLIQASYTREGVEGVRANGGSRRRDAVAQTVESLGGRLESFYFAFGDHDVELVAELPDNAAAAAIAMTVNASGGAVVRTRVLLTPEEVGEALGRIPPAGWVTRWATACCPHPRTPADRRPRAPPARHPVTHTPTRPDRERRAEQMTATTPPAQAPTSALADARDWFASKGLTRPREGRILGGVTVGFARRYDMDPLVARVLSLTIALVLTPVLYVPLWVLMPADPSDVA
jgi:uncharacterized protein with GYD domain/phage shock protein PspC (stress-responsive transcriptional regulator)